MNFSSACLICLGLLIAVSCLGLLNWIRYRRQTRLLEFKVRNLQDMVEALGDMNRFFASQKLGRPATGEEAIMYYINHPKDGDRGGPKKSH